MMIDDKDIMQVTSVIDALKSSGSYSTLLDIIGVPTLQRLNIEAAKAELSPLIITRDYKFLLPAYNKEVELSPINKAVYILFLKHQEGIEFKRLIEYRQELIDIYCKIGSRVSMKTIEDTVDRLCDATDNSIHEKCARIKAAFAQCMDVYKLSYYAIAGHSVRQITGSSKVWYDRRKTINLPRELVEFQFEKE